MYVVFVWCGGQVGPALGPPILLKVTFKIYCVWFDERGPGPHNPGFYADGPMGIITLNNFNEKGRGPKNPPNKKFFLINDLIDLKFNISLVISTRSVPPSIFQGVKTPFWCSTIVTT